MVLTTQNTQVLVNNCTENLNTQSRELQKKHLHLLWNKTWRHTHTTKPPH